MLRNKLHSKYNNKDNQLGTTITICWWFQSAQHVSGDNFAHPEQH